MADKEFFYSRQEVEERKERISCLEWELSRCHDKIQSYEVRIIKENREYEEKSAECQFYLDVSRRSCQKYEALWDNEDCHAEHEMKLNRLKRIKDEAQARATEIEGELGELKRI